MFDWVGGSGLGAKMICENVCPGVDPLDRDNLLGFFIEPLTGTSVPSSGRHSVVAKSPLMGIWREASVGGRWGRMLRKSGYDEHAEEEGVKFKFLTSPTKIWYSDDYWVTGMECLRYELGKPDDSGRRSPVPVKGSEFIVGTDTVVVAIGQEPNSLISRTTSGLACNRKGNIIASAETGATSKPGVFAGGDVVTGAATVILAMGAGRTAARSMQAYLVP